MVSVLAGSTHGDFGKRLRHFPLGMDLGGAAHPVTKQRLPTSLFPLHAVPCIILRGLSDEVMILTDTVMGIEDVMTKPVSNQTLIAIITDTVKRDRQIKSRRKARRVALLGALEIP